MMTNDNEFKLLSQRELAMADVGQRWALRCKRDWQSVLKTQQGRRVIWEILSLCGNDADGFSSSPYDTAYNCGLRAIGLAVRQKVKAAGHGVLQQMEDEYTALAKQDQQEINEASED